MPKFPLTGALFALFLTLKPVIAEDTDLSADIVGCHEVGCYDRCTVNNQTYVGIGLARIPNVPSQLEGLSLVKAVNVSDSSPMRTDALPRAFQSVYYLGAPAEMNVENLSGCAVIFNDPPAKNFSGPDTLKASGACSDVIEEDCIDALTRRAKGLAGEESQDTCGTLRRNLVQNPVEECSDYRGEGRGLGNFTVAPLNNLSAVHNSSNCWPILPKSDRLFQIGENTVMGNWSGEHILDKTWAISSVLTVVFRRESSNSTFRATTQLTCLKVVTDQEDAKDSDTAVESAALNVVYRPLSPWLVALFGILFYAL